MTVPTELKKGDACPHCQGSFIQRPEADSAAGKIKDHGALYRCTGCGYYARLK